MPKFTKQATQAKNAASDRVCAYKCKGLDSISLPQHTNQEGREEYTYIYNSAPKYSLWLFLNGELENI